METERRKAIKHTVAHQITQDTLCGCFPDKHKSRTIVTDSRDKEERYSAEKGFPGAGKIWYNLQNSCSK